MRGSPEQERIRSAMWLNDLQPAVISAEVITIIDPAMFDNLIVPLMFDIY